MTFASLSLGFRPTIVGSLGALYRWMPAIRRRQLLISALLMVVSAVLELATVGAVVPLLVMVSAPAGDPNRLLVDRLLTAAGWGGVDPLVPAVLFLVVVAVVAAVTRLILTWYSQKFIFRLGHDIGVRIYDRMLWQPFAFHAQRNSSEVLAGIEKVQTALYGVLLPLLQGVTAAVMAVCVVALLFVLDPFIATIAAGSMAAIYLGVSLATRRQLRANSVILNVNATKKVQAVQEGLGGIREILLDEAQPIFVRIFADLDLRHRNAQALGVFISTAPRFVVESAGIVLIALLALLLSGRPGGVLAALPVLGAIALGAQRLLPMLQQIYVAWSSLGGMEAVLVDLVGLIHAPVSDHVRRDPAAPVLPFARAIECDRVQFRYVGSDEASLCDVSLTIPQGARVGLVGKTGSGKSTLIDLLMGLLEPTAGTIRIDGRPLDATTRAAWQAQIAHVPQTIYLIDNTIAANIAFGVPAEAIDMDRVRTAARAADVASFVEPLPLAYDTVIGERGVRLSGGQRQRIGIARALYKEARVLILDEATSALDNQTESAVMAALDAIGGDITVIVVAHRLTTLSTCDFILAMEGGSVGKTLSYLELIGQPTPERATSAD